MQLDGFAERINEIALATIRADGHHAAMFFLLSTDGGVRPKLFSTGERTAGENRMQELAEAAQASDVEAVAVVSEAWAGDDARDVLLVAAIDRVGEVVAYETPAARWADGTVEPGKSRRHGHEYQVNVFDGVRAVWGLPRRRDLGFGVSAVLPADWDSRTADKIIELLPPSDRAAAHISIFRRPPKPVSAAEARSMLERFPGWRNGSDHVGPVERADRDELVATGAFVDGEHRVEVAVRVGPAHALVFSFNDDGSEDALREASRSIFESVRISGRE